MKDCCDWSGLCGSWIPHSSAYSCGRSVCLNPIFLSLPYSFLLEKASIALAAVVGAHHWKYQRKDWAASWIFFPGKVNSPCFFPFFSTSWKSCFFSFFSKKQIELIAEKHRQINFSTACLEQVRNFWSVVSAFFLKLLLGRWEAIVMVNFTQRGRKGW